MFHVPVVTQGMAKLPIVQRRYDATRMLTAPIWPVATSPTALARKETLFHRSVACGTSAAILACSS
jgi:hypothetical protein